MNCKHCEKEYHLCSACDTYDMPWLDRGYCSDKCWKDSIEYKNHIEKAKKFFSSMTRAQLDFWENEGQREDEFLQEYNEMVKKRREEIDNYIIETRNVR